MPLAKRCLDCGTRTRGTRCATCTHLHTHAHGRNTHRWQQLRAARKQLDGHRCTYCGSTQDLTVHLHPRLAGNHRNATLADCVTACRSCNSSLGDGDRKSQSPAVTVKWFF